MGYTERQELVAASLKVLTGSQDLLKLATETHNSAMAGKDGSNEFWKALDETVKN
jgi:hypothetical protein